MASFGPAPKLPVDVVVQPVKSPLGGSVSEIIGPAPNRGVEFAQEHLLWLAQSGLNAAPNFIPQCLDVTLCGCGQECVPKLAHSMPQKVEPCGDVGDDGLLL